jgi:hypothetical protein
MVAENIPTLVDRSVARRDQQRRSLVAVVVAAMEAHADYLVDLGRLLRDQAIEARDSAAGATATDFDRGQLFAFYRVLSLMQQQADAFDLPVTDFSLDGLDRDLLLP